MRITLISSALVLGILGSACAPGPAPTSSSPSRPAAIIQTGGGAHIQLSNDGQGNRETLDFAPDRVWNALPEAYAALGIEVVHNDPARRQIGNRRITTTRRIGNIAASRVLNCGQTVAGQPAAGVHRLTVDLLTTVSDAPNGGSVIETRIIAHGRDQTSSSDPVQCTSTGFLESQIALYTRGILVR